MEKKTIPTPIAIIVIVLVTLLAGAIITYHQWLLLKEVLVGSVLIPCPPCTLEESVTITTDKTEHEQGEIIKVTVKNNLDKSIWYIKETCPPSCCNLFKWESNEWENLGDPMPCIQLVPPPLGESYSIEPDELKPEESISKQWDMTIAGKPAESGRYRFSFYCGLNKDNYTEKTIYSNEFTIK